MDDLPKKADPTVEMLPGGEGVERPVAEPPPLNEAVTPAPPAPDDLLMRQAYDKAAEAARTAGAATASGAGKWQSEPQFPGQVTQPGMSRPARFETRVFNLLVQEDRLEHDRLMTEVQRPDACFIMNRERQWSPDTQAWHVLMELQYYEFLHTLTHAK